MPTDAERIIERLAALIAAELRQVHQAAADLVAQQATWQPDQAEAEHETYRQEWVRCGKAGCRKCSEGQGHGPYWYAYSRQADKVKKRYVGKNRP